MRTLVVTVGVASLVGLFACEKVDPYGDLSEDVTFETTETAPLCPGSMAGMSDPTILTACTGTKGSKGRCVPKLLLGTLADTFEKASCKESQVCLPEKLVTDGSKVKLKTCTGIGNAEGRCFWPLAKEILSKYDLLKRGTGDQCDDEQVCAPCSNPLTGQETGICSLGGPPSPQCKKDGGEEDDGAGGIAAKLKCPLDEPILEAENLPPLDCGSNMACVDKSLVGAQADKLRACAKGVCAPLKALVRAGNFIPKTCRSLAGAEGRCANVGIPMIGEQKALLPQAECDPDERCAPCFDPRTADDTQACRQSRCDAPKEKPKTLPTCCGGGGRCVPKAVVPAESQATLGADTCSGDTPLCAPNQVVGSAAGKACTLLGKKGICVSACTVLGLKSKVGELISFDCEDGDLCAPCSELPPGTKGCS